MYVCMYVDVERRYRYVVRCKMQYAMYTVKIVVRS